MVIRTYCEHSMLSERGSMGSLLNTVLTRMQSAIHKQKDKVKREECAGKEEYIAINMERRAERRHQASLLPHANLSAECEIRDSWNNYGVLNYLINITIVNDTTEACGSWDTEIYFNQPVTLVDSWNCNCTVEGCCVRIASTEHNAGLGIGGTYTMAGCILASEKNLTLCQ